MKSLYWLAGVVVCVLIGAFAYAVSQAREAARQLSCRGSMSKLQLALRTYESDHGHLPPAYIAGPDGKPWHSWRVLILPYFEEQAVYEKYRFDEPWNGPNNSRLADQIRVEIFQCASGPDYETTLNTNYVAVVGEGTAFPGDTPVRLADIRDGLENTILLVEIAHSDIHWMEPRDLNRDSMSFDLDAPDVPCVSSHHHAGPGVVFADEIKTYRLRPHLQPKTLRALLSIAGGEPLDRDGLIRSDRNTGHFLSDH
jgi:hypothetical protein